LALAAEVPCGEGIIFFGQAVSSLPTMKNEFRRATTRNKGRTHGFFLQKNTFATQGTRK